MSVTSLFLASIFAVAAAGPAFQTFVVQESLSGAPAGFAKVAPAAASSSLNLRIALPSNDVAGLEKALLDVSTPSSSNYGNHLSKAEVNAFLAPSDEAVAAVQAWLASHGLVANTSSSAGDWLSVNVPVSKANDMLSANYQTFKHIASGKTYARTLSFSLPTEVADFVDHIHPTTTFNSPLSLSPVLSVPKPVAEVSEEVSSDATAASCATTITPIPLQDPTTAATESSNSIAKFRTNMASSTTFKTQLLDGGKNSQGASTAGVEANLDIQYTVGIATGVPVFFVSVGESFQDGDLEGFLDIVNFLSDEDDVPQVMSTSYGENETDMSKALAFKLCTAYAAFGARGTSVLFASGDGGVEGGQSQTCTKYQAAFPAGCPFLTAVGSVHGTSPETASTFSSGGFSNYWGAPDYQSDAVAAYLKAQGTTNNGLFNVSGRGYPDVAAQGENVQIVSGGTTEGVDGTSCSTPIFASVVALLNDQLIAAGNAPLGFLNPWLYANPSMLNDVTTGSNPGCGAKGFAAKAGWDPVTGLGTPDFTKMKAAAGL
ncbi:family S53 protease [Mycena rosella]|uniref:tripeptidyl-peptidase II n=1 Tax=Mycena rosella TaxID=1033263 RepID=A0AAD7D6W7_MYCRO|nr:family S53 protease [Mycena rosella]